MRKDPKRIADDLAAAKTDVADELAVAKTIAEARDSCDQAQSFLKVWWDLKNEVDKKNEKIKSLKATIEEVTKLLESRKAELKKEEIALSVIEKNYAREHE